MTKPVVRLMGGLGNQMFQYAFACRLASESGEDVRFDVEHGFLGDPYRRKLALGVFNTKVIPASQKDIPWGISCRNPLHRFVKFIWLATPRTWQRVRYERALFRFDESMISEREFPRYYFGYWQNEGYFLPIRDIICRAFQLNQSLSGPVLALASEMAACRSISLHVRTYNDIGSNAKVNRKARAHHGTCGADYYQRAVDRIGVSEGTVCYVFADNIAWAKQHLKLPALCRYVADITPCSDADEMILMSRCQHHVISNSSFSWWGAWLGHNPDKIVVAPKIWIRGLPEHAVDICPKNWARI